MNIEVPYRLGFGFGDYREYEPQIDRCLLPIPKRLPRRVKARLKAKGLYKLAMQGVVAP